MFMTDCTCIQPLLALKILLAMRVIENESSRTLVKDLLVDFLHLCGVVILIVLAGIGRHVGFHDSSVRAWLGQDALPVVLSLGLLVHEDRCPLLFSSPMANG